MTIRSIEYLKEKFSWGDVPTQDDFADLIDTLYSYGGGYALLSSTVSGLSSQLDIINSAQYILNLLNNQIAVEQLDSDLKSSITQIPSISDTIYNPISGILNIINNSTSGLSHLINDPISGVVSQIAANNIAMQSINAQINQLTVSDFDPNVSYNLLQMVKYNGDVYQCILATTAPSPDPTNTTYWQLANNASTIESLITQEASARQTADSAEAQARLDLASQVVSGDALNAANITSTYNTLSTAISAATSASTSLTSQTVSFINNNQNLNESNAEAALQLLLAAHDNRKFTRINSANITNVQGTLTTLDSAVASAVSSLATQIINNGATASSSIQNEQIARTQAVSGVLDTMTQQLNTMQSQTASALASAFNTTSTSADSLGTAITSALNAVSASAANNLSNALTSYATTATLNSAIASATSGILSQTASSQALALTSYATTADLDSATVNAINTAVASAETNSTNALNSYSATANLNGTQISAINGLISQSTTGGIIASTLSGYATNTTLNSATASAINAAVASAGTNTSATITSYSATAGLNSTQSSLVQGIVSQSTTGFALASALTSYATTAALNTAIASVYTTVYSSGGSGISTIQQAFSSINGVNSEYTVKIDNSTGAVAGFGLINVAGSGSAFEVLADTFTVKSKYTSDTINPFTIGTTPLGSTIGINGQLIVNGSVMITGNQVIGGSLQIGGATFTYNSAASAFGPNQPILNSSISINSNGTLTGAGSGSVSLGGLGYTGSKNANQTFYGTSAPASGYIIGDLWYDSVNYTLKRYDGTSWNITSDSTSGALYLNSALSVRSRLNITDTGILSAGTVTGFKNGTGIWMDAVSGIPKMFVGVGDGTNVTQGFYWDGTTFLVRGTLNANDLIYGSLNGKILKSGYFFQSGSTTTNLPSYITNTTLSILDSTDFSSSGGTAYILLAYGYQSFSYTSKTPTTLNGCDLSGFYSIPIGSVVQPNRTQLTLDSLSKNLVSSYDSNKLVTIGFDGSHVISGYSDNKGLNLNCSYDSIYGNSLNGYGVVASCGQISGSWQDGTKAPMRIFPSPLSSAPTNSADLGALWVTSTGVLYICTGGTNWVKVGSQ